MMSTFAMNAATNCDSWLSIEDSPSRYTATSVPFPTNYRLYWTFPSSSSSYNFTASGSFQLLSNVSYSPSASSGIYGNLSVDFNPDPSASSVAFSVSLQSSSPVLRQMSHVCFPPNGSDRGLSIYVRTHIVLTSGPMNADAALCRLLLIWILTTPSRFPSAFFYPSPHLLSVSPTSSHLCHDLNRVSQI